VPNEEENEVIEDSGETAIQIHNFFESERALMYFTVKDMTLSK
jgi:hypothetical protein